MSRLLTTERLRRHDERGAILILALVMVLVFSVLAIAVLAFAGTSFRRTGVVKERVQKTASANAGIRYAIEQLGIDPTTCAQPINQAPNGGTVRLPTLANAKDVDLTCVWAGGLPTGANGWAMAITGENVSASTKYVETQGGSDPKPIVGPIYLPTPTAGRYDFQKAVNISKGNVVIRQGSCTTPPANPAPGKIVITSPSPPYGIDCTTQAWNDVITKAALRATPPPVPVDQDPGTAGNQFYKDISGCRVFFPGTYSSAAEMPLGNGPVYLASGEYYLNGLGELTISNAFIGGQPGPTDTFVMRNDAGSCATISDANAAIAGQQGVGGTGVTLFLGGAGANATSFSLNKGQMELFRRTTTDPAYPYTNLSVYSVPAGTPGWTAHTPSTDALVLGTKPGNGTDSVVHGTWVTPTGGVEFGNVAGKSTDGQFLGGLVASRAILQSAQSAAGNFIIRTDVGPFTRDLVLRSTAQGISNDMVATVVLSVSNEDGRPVAIRSWRVNPA